MNFVGPSLSIPSIFLCHDFGLVSLSFHHNSNARKYGDYRNLTFPGTEEDTSDLGEQVNVLQGGVGFGELSILSSTHKLRTTSAVGMTDEDLIFVMYEKTYNEGITMIPLIPSLPIFCVTLNFSYFPFFLSCLWLVLRKYHFRQQELTTTITYLGSIPLCESLPFSKLAQV